MIIYAALGVLIFAGWGLVPVFLGSNFWITLHGLNYYQALMELWRVLIVC